MTTDSGIVLFSFSDDFSASLINCDRWKNVLNESTNPDRITGIHVRQNGGLQLTWPRGYCNRTVARDDQHPLNDYFGLESQSVKSNWIQRVPLSGDFDVSVDFDGRQSYNPGGTDWSTISFGVVENPEEINSQFYMYNDVGPRSRLYHNGTSFYGGSDAISGKLRFARSGSTVTAYRWNTSTSSWDTFTGWSRTFSNELYVVVSIFAYAGACSSGTFRNLSCDVDYAESGTFESAVYDAGRTVTWEEISWTETLPTNTDVEFQIAVSSSAEGPWSYVGPDGTAGTKFSTASGQSVGMSVSGRYMKTKAFLTGDGTVTPTVSEVHVSHDGDVTSQFSSFVYDDAGNMTEKALVTDSSSVVETRTYNDMNELTANSVDDGTTTVNWTFSYDGNGNLTSRSDGTDTWDYTWDDENRLIEVEENSTTLASYQYDSHSRLIQRVADGTTTNYTWDGWGLVKEVKSGTITETTRYAVPHGGVTSFDRNGSRYYLHGDGLSSSQLVTNSSGNQAARIIYGAWGEELYSSDSVPNGLDARFVGGLGVRNEATTGLTYMRHRWYDASLQRFISRDPVGFESSYNLYEYGANNPVNRVDPSGLQPPVLLPPPPAPPVVPPAAPPVPPPAAPPGPVVNPGVGAGVSRVLGRFLPVLLWPFMIGGDSPPIHQPRSEGRGPIPLGSDDNCKNDREKECSDAVLAKISRFVQSFGLSILTADSAFMQRQTKLYEDCVNGLIEPGDIEHG